MLCYVVLFPSPPPPPSPSPHPPPTDPRPVAMEMDPDVAQDKPTIGVEEMLEGLTLDDHGVVTAAGQVVVDDPNEAA